MSCFNSIVICTSCRKSLIIDRGST
ncbi:hypothetical protein GKZ88_12350 [Flavobacterium sp. LC2016-01]|nr:hypothetical protein [Flavobacterium sp. LC2016-01]